MLDEMNYRLRGWGGEGPSQKPSFLRAFWAISSFLSKNVWAGRPIKFWWYLALFRLSERAFRVEKRTKHNKFWAPAAG